MPGAGWRRRNIWPTTSTRPRCGSSLASKARRLPAPPGRRYAPEYNPRGSSAQLPRVAVGALTAGRSEEHTSELQSRPHLVCRLLLEKKKNDDVASHLPKKKKIKH